jgi:iron(III) transport system permease protein
MFNPRIGAVNQWLDDLVGVNATFLNITSIVGMGFVEGLGLSALVYLMACAGLRSMDMSLEEAARTGGASILQTLRRVTIPLLYPHLLGAGLFVVAIAISSVDVPLIIGLANRHFVFSSYLYLIANPPGGVPEYGVAAAFSTVMIAIALLASWWYTRVLSRGRKYQVVTGKGYRPQRVKLGRYRWIAWLFVIGYFFWSTLMPTLMVIWSSLQPFLVPPSVDAAHHASFTNYSDLQWDQLSRAIKTTVELMIVVPTVAVIISIGFSWIVIRSRLKGRMTYDYVAFLPQAVPPLVFAFGAFLAALNLNIGIEIYGTFFLLALVMVLIQLAFGTRMVNSGLVQIHPELEEAGAMSGGSGWVILKRITVPLLKATLGYTWLWLALLAFRELTVPVMLGGQDTFTVSVMSWNLYNGGQIGQASAVAVVMMLALLPLLAFVLWLAGRGGRAQTFGGAA